MSGPANWHYVQKQILLGNASIGKSSLLARFTDDRWLEHSEPTIGVDYGSRLVTLDDGKLVKCQVWDSAGQECFRSITRSYFRGAQAALLVFSLTDRPSFVACKSWLDDLREYGEEDLVVLVVGNKEDLVLPDPDAPTQPHPTPDSSSPATSPPSSTTPTPAAPASSLVPRTVTYTEAAAFAAAEGLAGYVETSARTGSNVLAAFDKVTREAHKRHQADLATRKGSRGGAGSSFPLQGVAREVGKGCC